MWIVRLALKRPYTFVVLAIALLLLTPLIILRTPIDIFPAINIPVISVIWQYAGLSAQEIEQRILYLHERSLSATVNDIEHIEANAYNGVGVIKVFLRPGASVDAGVAQITAIAQTILRQMPPGQTPPLVIRYNASTVPILQYGIGSRTLGEQELYDLSQNQIRVGLSTVQGASVPWPYGGKSRLVSVDLDLRALQSHNLTAQDVVTSINAQNLILPSGTAKIGTTEYDVEELINPDTSKELLHLSQTKKLKVFVAVPQNLARSIVVGQKAEVFFQEFPNHPFIAEVRRQSGSIDAESRTRQVELELDNKAGQLLAGSFAQVRFPEVPSEGRLSLPANCLMYRPEGPTVAVVKSDDQLELRLVKVGRDFGPTLEILGGLEPNESVVINPPDYLVGGIKVRVVGKSE